jgi:hypothetical protein
MERMACRWLTLTVLILTARAAAAQNADLPRVEIGGNLSALVPIVYADGPVFLAGGGPRLGVNISRDIGLQTWAEAIGPFGDRSGVTGLYAAEFKFPLRRARSGQRTLSFTAGATGTFHYARRPEHRLPRPDGSTVVTPGYRQLRVGGPKTLILGLVRDHTFTRRGSVSTSVQLLAGEMAGIALRGALGVSFGAGGLR